MPVLTSKADDDFYFFAADKPDMTLARILELDFWNKQIAFRDAVSFIPCRTCELAPMNRGTVGTGRLNEALQEALTSNGFESGRPTPWLLAVAEKSAWADKVMQIRNNSYKDVYNGIAGCGGGCELHSDMLHAVIVQ